MITQRVSDVDVGLQDGENEHDVIERPIKRPARRPWWVIPAGIVILILVAWGVSRLANGSANAPHYLTAPVQYASINATVEETGTVNPVNEVDVGTQVSGTVASLNVDFNSQ